MASGELPAGIGVADPFGYASAALAFDLDLAPGGTDEVYLAVPLSPDDGGDVPAPDFASGPEALETVRDRWTALLGQVRFQVPDLALAYAQTCRSAAAHILINRDGPALPRLRLFEPLSVVTH